MDTLEALRCEIDGLDRQIAELYEKRMIAAEAVGQYKQTHGLPVFDSEREAVVLKKTASYIRKERYKADFRDVMTLIMSKSRKLQEKKKKETKGDG